MATNYADLYKIIPRWTFAVLSIFLIGVMIYSLFFAKCRIHVFGLTFGPDTACTGSSGSTEHSSISQNAIVPFEAERCPAGWEIAPNLQGRYLVGAYLGEPIAQTIGSRLEDLENRTVGKHSHEIRESGMHGHTSNKSENHSHAKFVNADDQIKPIPGITVQGRTVPEDPERTKGLSFLVGDVSFNAPGDNGIHAHNAQSSEAHNHKVQISGYIEGTNSPYVTMLFCKKL